MSWVLAGASEIGGRDEQQDRIGFFLRNETSHLAVVADGMGGHEDGAAAAEAVIDVVRRHAAGDDPNDPRRFLETLCLDAHEAINAIGGNGLLGAGSTCVILYVQGSEAYWVHVGDGRLYHFREGRLLSRTRDHSVVELMVQQGHIGEDEAAHHPLQNQIYMRLGGEVTPEPEFGCLSVEPEDVLLLCSDGFWELVTPAQMGSVLYGSSDDLAERSARLMQLARRACSSDADNISVVVAQWGGGNS